MAMIVTDDFGYFVKSPMHPTIVKISTIYMVCLCLNALIVVVSAYLCSKVDEWKGFLFLLGMFLFCASVSIHSSLMLAYPALSKEKYRQYLGITIALLALFTSLNEFHLRATTESTFKEIFGSVVVTILKLFTGYVYGASTIPWMFVTGAKPAAFHDTTLNSDKVIPSV